MPIIHPADPSGRALPTVEARPDRDGRGPDDLVDWRAVRAWVEFFAGAVRRRKVLAAALLGLCVEVAALSLWALPKTYRCEVKIVAEPNYVMPNLGNPRRTIPRDADAPTRGASEIIMRRAGLLAIVQHTDLLKRWEAGRAPAARLADAVREGLLGLFGRAPTDEDRLEALLGVLERRIEVRVQDAFITIAVAWQDAESAYLIADAARQGFLEERHAREIATIAETISVLESQAAQVRDTVNTALEDLRRARPVPAAPRVLMHTGRALRERERNEPAEVTQLRTLIAAKARALAEMEDFRRRRSVELQTQLAEQRAIYGSSHPILVATQNSIDALAKDSPQVAALRAEEAELVTRFVQLTGQAPQVSLAPTRASQPPPAVVVTAPGEPLASDEAEVLRAHVRTRAAEYEDLVGRIDAARIELDTARAGFKHRYATLQPGKVPKKPLKPKPAIMLGAGLFAGLLLAVAIPGLLELVAGTWPAAASPPATPLSRRPPR